MGFEIFGKVLKLCLQDSWRIRLRVRQLVVRFVLTSYIHSSL